MKTMIEVLTYDGLKTYDSNIKEFIGAGDSETRAIAQYDNERVEKKVDEIIALTIAELDEICV